jgi:transposase
MTLLCHFPGCRILRVMRDSPNALLVAAEARRDASRCPACRPLSTSVHSRDHRQPADRPVSGQAIRLRLTIRRFSCRNPSCPRRTFAEQLPHRLGRHAQRTRRLAQAQVQTALALGGAPAARLLSHLAMPASPTTLLQAIRRRPLPAQGRPSLVGVDDWALRKGRTSGTILVDLERRRPLDLLPDRSASTFANGLRREPQIRLVARDRSTEYARGAATGAPEAVQVADRWRVT